MRLIVVLLATAALVGAPAGAAPAGATAPPGPPTSEPLAGERPVVTENEFVPADRDVTECISAVPKPGCGTKQQGGWRQQLVFAVLIAGMVAIAARITVAVRRRDRALTPH